LNFRADRFSPVSRDLLARSEPPRRHSYRGVLRLCELRGESLYIATTNEATNETREAAREPARARARDKRFIVLSLYAADSPECEELLAASLLSRALYRASRRRR